MKPAEYIAAELDKLHEEWRARHLPALFEAVHFCQLQNLALPEWAALAVLNVIIEKYNRARRKGGKGTFETDYHHHRRWIVLSTQFNEHGVDYAKKHGRMKGESKIAAARKAAVNALRGTRSQCTVRQLQKSYDLVEAAKRSGKDARFRFD